jgi:hypothetical protein
VDPPPPLIRDYDEEWRVDYRESFESPDHRLYLAAHKSVSDGSLLVVMTKIGSNAPGAELFVIKISPAGEIVNTVTFSEEYDMRSLYPDSDGFLLTFQLDNSSSYVQYRIDASLKMEKIPFTFSAPPTFYRLLFTPAGIILSEYDGNLEGIRVKRFTYEGEQVLDIGYDPHRQLCDQTQRQEKPIAHELTFLPLLLRNNAKNFFNAITSTAA